MRWQLFSSLHQDRKAWDGVPLGGAGNVSGIRVPDRNDKARNSVVFKRAINVNGLALTEYMDWYVDGKSLGKCCSGALPSAADRQK